jgi:hypothetical protein
LPRRRRHDHVGSSPIDSDSRPLSKTRLPQTCTAGVQVPGLAWKIALHLDRFRTFFLEAYGHERIDACLPRDVAAWQRHLAGEMAPSTVNGHLASLSAWARAYRRWSPEHSATTRCEVMIPGVRLNSLAFARTR